MRNYRKALRRAVYRTPLPGGKWIILGGLILLVWSVWEGVVRFDSIDGMTKAYFHMARENGISFLKALKYIWDETEARRDILNIAYLALIAAFSMFSMLLNRRWGWSFVLIPLCGAVFLYHPSNLIIVQALSLFEVMKAGGCALVLAGCGLNIGSALRRRAREQKRLMRKQQAKRPARQLSHGTEKTLVPVRKNRKSVYGGR